MKPPTLAGLEWEREFVELAINNGLTARKVDGDRPHDAIVNGLKVQCKNITYQRHNGRVRIGKSSGKNGVRRYRKADFDVLALNFRGECFFIPAQLLCGVTGRWPSEITIHRFRRCRNNWSVFCKGGDYSEPVQQTLWDQA